jgi:hypothetical protein
MTGPRLAPDRLEPENLAETAAICTLTLLCTEGDVTRPTPATGRSQTRSSTPPATPGCSTESAETRRRMRSDAVRPASVAGRCVRARVERRSSLASSEEERGEHRDQPQGHADVGDVEGTVAAAVDEVGHVAET